MNLRAETGREAERGERPGRHSRAVPSGDLQRGIGWLRTLSPAGATAVALALMTAVGVGDEITGAANFTLLYLGPIGFATWFAGLRAGLALSAASTAVSFVSDLHLVPAWSPAMRAWNLLVQLGVFVALALLLGALRNRLIFERQVARTDSLTGIANRRDFLDSAALELERTRRHLRPLSVAYLDLDDFKSVNDRFGHEAGDAVLVAVATALREATRAVDAVARLGGDEFGLLLPETDGPTAEAMVGRLERTLADAVQARGWPVTFSIGVVTFHRSPRSVDEMINRADELMYQAKRAGKRCARLEVVARASADRPSNLGY
jgi:diguanylate cyclase (GGDEF)-like protein